MNTINDYLNKVERHLLLPSKKEILNEIRNNIIDQLNDDYSDDNVEEVLNSFGDPIKLAISYYPVKRHLIGPAIFDRYIYTLVELTKITLLIGVTYILLAISKLVVESNIESLTILDFLNPIGIPALALFYILMVVLITAGFIVFEQFNLDAKVAARYKAMNPEWTVAKLQPKVNKIDRQEAAVSIIFIVLTAIILRTLVSLTVGEYFGEFDQSFELVKPEYRHLLNYAIIFGASFKVLEAVLKVILGRWTVPLSVYSYLLATAIDLYIIYVAINFQVFNGIDQAIYRGVQGVPEVGLFNQYMFTYIIVGIMILDLFIESGVFFSRIHKNSKNRRV